MNSDTPDRFLTPEEKQAIADEYEKRMATLHPPTNRHERRKAAKLARQRKKPSL